MKRTPEAGDIVRIKKTKKIVKVLFVFPASGYARVEDGKNEFTIHKSQIVDF